MSKNKIFLFFTFSFISSVFLGNYLLDIKLSFIISLFLFILLLNYYLYSKKNLFIIISIIIWIFFWSIYSYNYVNKVQNKQKVISNYFDNKKHKLVSEIVSTYKVYDFERKQVIKVLTIDENKIDKDIYLLATIPINYKTKIWDIIIWEEKLNKVENFADNFDYIRFMQSKNIYSLVYFNHINIDWNNASKFKKYLSDFRQNFLSTINDIFPKEEAIFLWGILIWARENLPKELSDNFNNSGLTHLIAVSWFNITIIIIFLTIILKIFPIFIRVIIITLFIIIFTLIVWDNAAVIRASIMWLIWYYILMLWRKNASFTILLLTAFLMTLYNPFSISFDISFHLSFLAVLWILFTQNFWNRVFYFVTNKLVLKESLVMTMSAFSFTLPIMIFNFGQVSIISPISNVLVAPAIPIAMLLGFISVILYLLYPLVWVIFWFIAWLFLKYVIIMVHYFGSLKYSVYKVNLWDNAVFFELFYFIVLIFLILYLGKEKSSWKN